ncbi:Lrp/AsnC family transcriptional regulator [Candidatus Erwinia haradaeae]|uniref:DNA-binding transcriptional activator DecR n=1 Tax=Candidatus Erwinia haradaeae TaxID=1922217 RepID=A0A803FUB1_9GAMM|nr:Lrp/AsnC family transcriptional regulator [Candidatus Erwinia haradaeae]VFP88636.1 DNA-binding transcriptional activator DecR [Candidatus Erwinia haradaeae]
MLPITLDKKDRLLLNILQKDCTLSLQVLAEEVCLTTTPCWKRLKRLDDEGYIRGRVALLNSDKLGLDLTAFVLIKTHQHTYDGFDQFVSTIHIMPEVMGFYRMAGEYDYLLRVQVADMKSYDRFYKNLLHSVPTLLDVTSSFAMEEIKYTTALPVCP